MAERSEQHPEGVDFEGGGKGPGAEKSRWPLKFANKPTENSAQPIP